MRSHRTTLPGLYRGRLTRLSRWTGGLLIDLTLAAGLVVAVEASGRTVEADWQGFLVFAVAAAVWTPFFFGRASAPLAGAVAKGFQDALGALRRRFHFRFGLDFRPSAREPRFRLLQGIAVLLFALLAASCAFAPFPAALLEGSRRLSGLLFVFLVGAVWLVLGVTILVAASGAFFYFQTLVQEPALRENPAVRRAHPRLPRKALAVGAVVLLGAAGLEILFGPRGLFAAGVFLTLLHLALLALPRPGEAPALLVHHLERRTVRRTGIVSVEHTVMAIACLWVTCLLCLAAGARAVPGALQLPLSLPEAPAGMEATVLLGRAAAFVSLLFLLPVTFHAVWMDAAWFLANPGKPRRKTLGHEPGRLEGRAPGDWRFLPSPRAPGAEKADLDYDPEGRRGAKGTAPSLKRNFEGLPDGERLFLLDHFDFITKRRDFYRGLSRLMKIASGLTFRAGNGFLLCPHLFFIEGLHRDDEGGEEGESRIIGPPFRKLWRLRTRRFLHEMLSDLEVDFIYFEDAVKWPVLRKVFDQMFERAMKNPRAGPLSEADFRFLPGVRVFVEFMEPDRELPKRKAYEEPHFANLSRARVLMIYKDRGDQDQKDRQNNPEERVPAPLAR